MTEGIKNLKESILQLDKAQCLLAVDKLNHVLCQRVKNWTVEVLNNSELEEKILQQRAKENSIKQGYGNNKFFMPSLK